MSPKKQALYYVGFCRICGTGPLGLRVCGQCGKLVVLCDECDAIWTSADLESKPLLAATGDMPCPDCGASLIEPPSHWATPKELETVSWLQRAIRAGELQLQQGSAFAPNAEEDNDTDTDTP